ncbi:hypothetical protein HYDPIDRAFT_43747 [Hydnomerulius pinastri MD-312]|uniref:Uncharacterized protein n=1 Tax=Hydnomerulius pinastri MD-312 TaxID=994086 RepID=A0A0C9WA04_9AGAM|nr:hypothetical protein HYDPIDRAFT_43747 [Hydnomerulius pinastri MD-312]
MSSLRSFITFALLFGVSTQGAPVPDDSTPPNVQPHVVPFWPWQPTQSEAYGLRPVQQAIQLLIDGGSTVHNSPEAPALAPYQQTPTVQLTPPPNPSASRIPHASIPVQAGRTSNTKTPIIVGIVLGVLFALLVLVTVARYLIRRYRLRRRSIASFVIGTPEKGLDPFQDPPSSKARPALTYPFIANNNGKTNDIRSASPASTFTLSRKQPPPIPIRPHDLELRNFTFPRERKLVAVTTSVGTPSDVTVFGSRIEFGPADGKGQRMDEMEGEETRSISISPGNVYVPLRIPSPTHVSPFSPAISPVFPLSPSSSSTGTHTLSPSPSGQFLVSQSRGEENTENQTEKNHNLRLSRLLASSFRDTRTTSFRTHSSLSRPPSNSPSFSHHPHTRPTRPNPAYLPLTTPSSTSLYTTSLYARATGTAASSTTSFYAHAHDTRSSAAYSMTTRRSSYARPGEPYEGGGRRDTMTTITTQDTTSTVPYLLRAGVYARGGGGASVSPSPSVVGVGVGPSPSLGGGGMGVARSSSSVSDCSARAQGQMGVGTPLGLGVRVSDASEHESYREGERQRARAREAERIRERERDVERAKERERERERERGWKPPGSPSSSRSVSPSTNPFHTPSPSPSPSSSRSRTPSPALQFRTVTPSLSSRPSLYRAAGEEEASPVRAISRRRAGSVSRVVSPSRILVRSPHQPPSTEHERRQRPPSMHGRTKSAPGTSPHAHTSTSSGARETPTPRKYALRDSESVLQEIGW